MVFVTATLTAVFKTNLRTDFPFDVLELVVFAVMGLVFIINDRTTDYEILFNLTQ